MSLIMNKIALLKGGLNSENEVSLKTAEACFFALKELNNFVEKNLLKGVDVLFDIDWQGAQKLSNFSKTD